MEHLDYILHMGHVSYALRLMHSLMDLLLDLVFQRLYTDQLDLVLDVLCLLQSRKLYVHGEDHASETQLYEELYQ